jgi:hypothetical protein
VADVPSGLSLTQPQEAKKKLIYEEKWERMLRSTGVKQKPV